MLYSKIRPYLRKAVLVDFEGVCSADMYPLAPKGDPLFLLYWLISPAFNDLAMEHQERVVLPKINKKALYSIPTPIAPVDEQKLIGERLDAAMEWLDRVAVERESANLLDRLDQSILAKAFRDELVPQEPNDEPASVLLDRIRAERQSKPKAKGRGRKARAAL